MCRVAAVGTSGHSYVLATTGKLHLVPPEENALLSHRCAAKEERSTPNVFRAVRRQALNSQQSALPFSFVFPGVTLNK
jgi:hypothetical protein